MSHLLVTNLDLEISGRDMLGNRNILNVSPTPYGYSMLKYRLVRSLDTMLDTLGALVCRYLALC